MEPLPFHLLELTAYFVNCFSFDQRDLLAFAQVNRFWRSAAERYRFEKVQIQLKGYCETTGFEDIEKALSGNRRAWVRRLEITGGEEHTRWWTSLKAQREISQNDWIEGPQDSCEWLSKTNVNRRFVGPKPVQSWVALGDFIRSLPGLRDLIWNHPRQFPQCYLEILHREFPQTRLHIHSFRLRSLSSWPPPGAVTNQFISLEEWGLITSPNLHCISCHYTNSQQELAVVNMAGGVSPNLKHHTGYTETYRQSRWLPQPRFPWPDYLDSGEATNGNKANGITSLRLVLNATGDTSLYTPGPTNTLRAWELINLTRVRNLEIGYGGSSVVIQKLTIMAREGAFQSLASFSYGPFPKMDGTDLDLTLSLFLEGIPALKRLSLSGPVHSNGRTFTTILYHHGSALQNLRLDCGRHQPGLSSAEWIRKLGLLSEHCPNIQILSLGIARNQGDSSEVAVYRALSWLRRLKHLRLFLDFSEFHPRRLEASRDGGGVDDDEVSLVRSPFVDLATTRACLINSAIDSRLALSIFNIVGDRTSNLQSLHLSVRGDWIWTERCESNGSGDISIVTFATTRAGPTFQQDQDMKVLLKYVANPWIVTRGYQSSAIAKQDRFLNEDRALELSRGAARLRADFSGREDLKRIWTSVWPSKPEEPGDYRKAWWSYPLAGVDETACHG